MDFKGATSRGMRQAAILAGILMLTAAVFAQTAGQFYRIVILPGQKLEEAQRLKTILEDYKYSPLFIDKQDDGYRVLYGAFDTQDQARQALAQLRIEGINPQGIIQQALPASAPGPASPAGATGYTVFLGEYNTQAGADVVVNRLKSDPAGYNPVRALLSGRLFRVYVGNVAGISEASAIFDRLKQTGFTTDNVSKVVIAPEALGAPQAVPAASAPGTPGTPVVGAPAAPTITLPASITDSAMWKSLTDEQRQKVITESALRSVLNQNNDTVAQNVIDLDKRLDSLDKRVKELIENIDKEKDTERQLAVKIKNLVDEGENLIRANEYQQAIVSFKKALDLDKDNSLGQGNYIQARINVLEQKLAGNNFLGEAEQKEAKRQQLQTQADQLKAAGGAENLRAAMTYLLQIRYLDPEKYGAAIDPQIADIKRSIEASVAAEKLENAGPNKQTMKMIYGLGIGVAVLLVLVVFTWLRSRRQHKDLINRLHDITSATIRPMRGIEGTNAPLLETGGGTESDLFAPRSPLLTGRGEPESVDPLGGIAIKEEKRDKAAEKKAKQDKAKKGKKEPEAEVAKPGADSDDFDALFGGGPAAAKPASSKAGEDMGFDEIFGGPGGASPRETTMPSITTVPDGEPTKPGAPDDDIFSSLFSEEHHETIAPKKPAAAPRSTISDVGHHSGAGPISFGDGGGDEPPAESKPADENSDLLAMFDTAIGGDQADDAANGSGTGAMETMRLTPANMSDDDTEITGLKNSHSDLPGIDTAFSMDSFGGAPDSERTDTAFSMDSVAGPAPSGAPGVEQDFEDEMVGAMPSGWEGSYPFASLTVKGDTPPRGAQQYLCFEKKEGAGKAFFSRRFPSISGKVAIEFDLRCNDKNKFLLGIYVEKGGDFQQAIHTKILRSEAQTTPTIHMQGESAPYLLGSWAHIKYVVDLKAGKLNSYIDNTHVGRDVAIEPNPGSLDTLSIRDNINTTGVLLLDNIRVYPVA